MDLGTWIPPAERAADAVPVVVTLRSYAGQWLAERDVSPKTRALYQDLLDSRILPILGDEFISDISPALVRTWFAGMGDKTPTRRAHAFQLLRTIMNTATEDGLVSENPCKIKGAGQVPKRRDIVLLTGAELAAVSAAMPESYRAAVPVAAGAALRFGELIELRRKDVVVTDSGTLLRVRRACVRVGDKMVVGAPKSAAGVRDVNLPGDVAAVLAAHMKRHVGRGPESLLFRTTRGNRLSQSAFTKSFKNALPAGKKNMRVHDLRHTGAVLFAHAGGTTKEIMARLGHTTPEMAMRYQHVAAGRDAALAARMSVLDDGKDEGDA
ncbi:tyrosine-type recombinase/integrase [Gordonia hirsuta]|nr:tyrosine-type recombinase/integrase [Gordonia hirsuta]